MKEMIEMIMDTFLMGLNKEINNHKNLARLFFSHQGRKHCYQNNYPSLNKFQESKTDMSKLGIFVDAGDIIIANDAQVGLIGSTTAILFFTDNSKVYKLILMHGAKAKIVASNHTVILLANIGECDVEIEKDESVMILS